MESFYMPLGMMNLQGRRWEEWRMQETDWREREREKHSKRERKSRSVTTSKKSLQVEAGGKNAATAYSQQLTLGNPHQSILGSKRQSQS